MEIYEIEVILTPELRFTNTITGINAILEIKAKSSKEAMTIAMAHPHFKDFKI
jgi:hypothetical protein